MIVTATPGPGRLQLSDLVRLSTIGLRTRKLRAGLSALGIAIGVAAIVAVLGLSSSSQAGSVHSWHTIRLPQLSHYFQLP